jgi:predicted dehydrogenase
MVGSGYMARKHSNAIKNSDIASISALVVSPNCNNGEEFKNEFGIPSLYKELILALENEEIDIVFITSPNNLHTQQTLISLQSNKHVFCEKPLAYSWKEFDRIKDLLDNSKKVLQVGMNCRFREQYSIPKKILDAGEIGKLKYVRATYNFDLTDSIIKGEKKWWSDFPDNIMYYLHSGAIHALDLIRWIGGEIDETFAIGNAFELKDNWGKDTFVISVQYRNGAIGELTCSASAFKPPDFNIEIWGTNGSIENRKIYKKEEGKITESPLEVVQKKMDLLLQLEDMILAIENNQEPMNSFSEAQKNLELINAIEDSLKENKPIKISRKN